MDRDRPRESRNHRGGIRGAIPCRNRGQPPWTACFGCFFTATRRSIMARSTSGAIIETAPGVLDVRWSVPGDLVGESLRFGTHLAFSCRAGCLSIEKFLPGPDFSACVGRSDCGIRPVPHRHPLSGVADPGGPAIDHGSAGDRCGRACRADFQPLPPGKCTGGCGHHAAVSCPAGVCGNTRHRRPVADHALGFRRRSPVAGTRDRPSIQHEGGTPCPRNSGSCCWSSSR